METIICPCCGGSKIAMFQSGECRCEYCGHIFRAISLVKKDTPSSVSNDVKVVFDNIGSNSINAEGKNRTTAAILAFLLGGIGGHIFYLGKTGRGFLYLLFCWTGIPAVLGLVEGFMLITQSDDDFCNNPRLLF